MGRESEPTASPEPEPEFSQPPTEPESLPQPNRQRLPEINEKPTAPRGKRAKRIGRIAMVASGALFVTASLTFRFLQHHVPGPSPVVVQPKEETFQELVIKKGFPEQCLGRPYIALPDSDLTTPNLDDQKEKLDCVYRGHAAGQPPADDECHVVLERETYHDPYFFSGNVLVPGSEPIYLGKGSKFTDIPATQGVPAACSQENIEFPPY